MFTLDFTDLKIPLLMLCVYTLASSAPLQAEEQGIELAAAQYHEVQQERVIDALVEAVNKATVTAQTSGRVKQIYFDVNDYAKKDDVLLRMRDKDQQAKLRASQADFSQAETEFLRVQQLHSKNLISKSAVDKAESQFKLTRARLDQAEENLERTIVRAPYSGIVVKRHIEVGETAQTGAPLFTGLSLESLRVAVNLPQDIILPVRQFKAARVLVAGKSVDGKSMTISPYADADSHTFLVRVNLPQGSHGLYPGMAVKVAFSIGQMRKLLVPASAITHRSEMTGVYVMNDQKELSLLQVRPGQQINGNIEILSGLQENDQVAIDPVKATIYYKDHITN
ncbi:MAG: efflux transporter periplasmic adaptor subunit [endosymbiont of Galathealinum brachiosum]|uniref:Efflux transporter periplasmic adaptor subunit n=1 Tax=endosymbiont of Galathealinum brachiosum TaxID=2200906 RepID=A0A370DI99_9GAMM|nr:MAG: efflux transporter periplasmic adaptor subunit [endosymbiont of Galathealinum brachiosum]